MNIVKWLFGGALVLVAVLLLGGMLIAPTYKVTRSAVINAPADKVYGLVADPKQWKAWSVWNQRDPGMDISYFGPPSGSGAGWAWKSKSEGDGRMTFTAATPPGRVAYELYFPDFKTTSVGDFTFTPEGSATRVRCRWTATWARTR